MKYHNVKYICTFGEKYISEQFAHAVFHDNSTFQRFTRCMHVTEFANTIYWGSTLLSDSLPNNAVLVDSRPAVISAVRSDSIRIQRFQSLENWFDKCIPSSHLGIYECYYILHECKWVSIDRVQCKAILFPYNGFFIFYPIPHTYCTEN